MSGGTIHHPHSQIVGFETTIITTISSSITCRGRPSSKRTASKSISRPVPLSVSMKSTSFSEINKENFRNSSGICSLSPTISFTILCGATKAIIFFSTISGDSRLFVKIVPRFLTNPLYVGYMIAQVANKEHQQRSSGKLRTILSERK